MRVLILYTELAGYVLGNIKRFLENNKDVRLLLIHYPVNPEAPFELNEFPGSSFIQYSQEKESIILNDIKSFQANIILCSGWSNSFYLQVVKNHQFSSKCIICFDNKWKGKPKQILLSLFSRFYLLNMFQYAWVPGLPQKKYALKLGFKEKNVFTGLYPADTSFFIELGKQKLNKMEKFPKVMISVARYIPQKDLPTLWKAFIDANERTGNQWILNCIGLGEGFDSRIEHPTIHHLGFKQPHQIAKYILEAGVYVLPSIEEPWGVAVHEMALSALPLILSNQVGAASMFLNDKNGFQFQAGNQKMLEEVLYRFMQLSDMELWEMSAESFECGKKLMSEDWSKTLLQINNEV